MSARPRHHGPNRWDRRSGDNVRWAVRTLAQALGVGVRRHDWRDASRKRRQRGRWIGRSEPRWFARARPRRPFPRVPEPPRGRPFVNACAPWGVNGQRYPGRHGPLDWRDGVLPRRGHAVAVIKAPRCPGQKVLRERQPRGLIPRGTPGEAPKGQPRNHRPQRKQSGRRPMGRKEREKRWARSRKAPPSSRWRMGEKEDGVPSRGPMPGESAAFWRT